MKRHLGRGIGCRDRYHYLVCCCLTFVVLLTGAVYAQSRRYEDVYQKVFKKPFVKELQNYSDVNLISNGKFLGTVALLAPATGPIEKIAASSFLDLIRISLNDEAYAELLQMVDGEGFIAERGLSLKGYVLTLNRSKGYLTMVVPRDKRTEFVYVDLQGGYWSPDDRMSMPVNTLSGYVNMRANMTHAETDAGRTDEPVSLDIESVMNMNGMVLRQVGNLESDSATPYALSAIQGVHDSADFTRYVVGDVDFPARGFQGVPRVFGVGVGKLYYLNRQLLDSGNQGTSVKITKDGVMQLLLNGRDLRQMPVEQGTYILENIPTRLGVNRLDILLTYADGTKETRTETFIRDTDLIGVGQSEFYYAAGIYSDSTNRQYQIQTDSPVASLYHLYRPSAFWLQGVYGQIDQTQRLLGLDTYFPTIWGVFRLDTAQYMSETASSGGFLEYKTYYDPDGLVGYQRISVATYEEGFRRFGDATVGGVRDSLAFDTNFNLSRSTFLNVRAFGERYYSKSGTYYGGGGSLSQELGVFRFAAGGSYAMTTEGESDYTIYSDAYLNLNREWMSSLQLRWRNLESVGDMTVSFYLTWVPGAGAHAFTVGQQGSDHSQRAAYAYADGQGYFGNVGARFSEGALRQADFGFGQRNVYSDFQFNSSLSSLSQTEDMFHSLRYWNTRGLLDVQYTESKAKDSGNFSRRTNYRLETALAFADGQIAFGRPIRSNFVLVYPEEGLSGRSFTVGSNGLVDGFGPAVLTDLPAWSETLMSVGEIADVPEGYDLGSLRNRVNVGYYSGQAIQIGKGMRTRVFGTAQTAKGPLAYVACDVFLEKTPDQVVTRVLTGPDGGFLIQGLDPGRYGFRLQAFTNDIIYFEIEDSKTVRSYDMGVVMLKHLEE